MKRKHQEVSVSLRVGVNIVFRSTYPEKSCHFSRSFPHRSQCRSAYCHLRQYRNKTGKTHPLVADRMPISGSPVHGDGNRMCEGLLAARCAMRKQGKNKGMSCFEEGTGDFRLSHRSFPNTEILSHDKSNRQLGSHVIKLSKGWIRKCITSLRKKRRRR